MLSLSLTIKRAIGVSIEPFSPYIEPARGGPCNRSMDDTPDR
jgi:hypothetical protein